MNGHDYAPRHVMICRACGKGFLIMPRGGYDPDPIWHVLLTGDRGPVCAGRIETVLKPSTTGTAK